MKMHGSLLDTQVLARFTRSLAVTIFVTALSACDHGPLPPVTATPAPLSASSTTDLPTVTPNALGPISTSTASPLPSAEPTGTPVAGGVSGMVLDRDNGRPLENAVIVLAHEMYATATPPDKVSDGVVGTTAADGSFHLQGVVPGTYPIEVYAPGHIAIHQQITIANSQSVLPAFHTSHLTPEEQNWLNQVNRDRASWGAPALVADEAIVEAARMRTSTMADNGVFSHDCLPNQKNCLSGPAAEIAHGAFQAGGENIGAQNEGTWRDVESGMLAEWERCSPGVRKPHINGCSFSEDTGHFLNIVNRSYHFVGVAAHHHGRSFDVSYGPSTDYYAMEFE